ncbi:MAG: hypothetical protein JWP87_2520 [Labilithrix sp.]|nr:hypothetical protein [Labilithrix sp.]
MRIDSRTATPGWRDHDRMAVVVMPIWRSLPIGPLCPLQAPASGAFRAWHRGCCRRRALPVVVTAQPKHFDVDVEGMT